MNAFPAPQGVDSPTFTPPPVDGTLSLPEIYDFHAHHSPNHPLFVFHDGTHIQQITWAHAVRAIHTAARFVEESLPKVEPEKKFSTVIGILAMTDFFTQYALLVGIIRAGYQAFPISSRNNAAGLAHLIQKTRLRCLFVSDDVATQRLLSAACAELSIGGYASANIDIQRMPTFDQLFYDVPEEDFVPLPPITAPPHPTDTALILHSSGTTSLPKPISLSHRSLIQWGLIPYYGEVDICGEVLSCHPMPFAYGAGAIKTAWAMMSGVILANFPPTNFPVVPTPERVFSSAIETGCTIMFCVPSFIETWAKNPDCIAPLTRFRAVGYAGAPMHKDTGERLSKLGVHLFPIYGTTEVGGVSSFIPAGSDPDGWAWFRFSAQCRPHLVPQYDHNDDVYQLILLESPTSTPNLCNTKVGGVKAYDTNDLVMRHPNDPTLWKVVGRVDDQVTHINGLKTNPALIETIVTRHQMVKSAIVFGRGKLQAGILIEPEVEYIFDPADEELFNQYRETIWTAVEKANQSSPPYSRIRKEMILVTDPYKTLEYTSKNTLDRTATLNTYRDEIERLYTAAEVSCSPSTHAPTDHKTSALMLPPTWGLSECLEFTRTLVHVVIPFALGDDDDFFQAGCDSLQATWLRNVVSNALRRTSNKVSTLNISRNFVYSYPTIRKLATFISHVMNYGHSCVALSMSSGKFAEMEGLVRKYSTTFPLHRPSGSPASSDGEVVLLTGSTGSLGSHLLVSLVNDPSVRRVYALNRPDSKGVRSVFIRQSTSFKDRGLDYMALSSDKLLLLEGNLALAKLGLDDDALYDEIVSTVTCIVHCAWHVNFNVALCSMEPLIAGTRNLIDLALSSPQLAPPRFIFTSSLNIFNDGSERVVAESCLPRAAAAIGYGYTESKWVAESILTIAAEHTPLRPSIIRLGQVTGCRNGSWNPREWFPILIRSAQILRCLPLPAGYLSWIPVDDAATAIMEMRNSNEPFLNLAHPNPMQASPIFEALADILQIPLVKYSDWLAALENSIRAPTGRQALSNPALTLIDFFRSAYGNSNSPCEVFGITCSATSRAKGHPSSCRQISRADVESWIHYWRKIGFLSQF